MIGLYTKIKEIIDKRKSCEEVSIAGWVRNKRSSNKYGFLSVNDGSCFVSLQIVVDFNMVSIEEFNKADVGSSVFIKGKIQPSQGSEQEVELFATEFSLLSSAHGYPLQPKKHSAEFLREISHLRTRTNTFSAIFRVRDALSFAIHKFFHENGFVYVNTPIITANDCEGAGEMFTVTTLDTRQNNEEYKNDFFGKHVGLTVSGQLELETAIFGLGNAYTFGPTFRAENSNTTRHLAEFWMLEAEIPFSDININMNVAEDLLKYVIKYVLDNCKSEMDFLADKARKEREIDLISRLENIVNNHFCRITYSEAIDILTSSKCDFKYKVDGWGCDLQSEHERFLVETIGNNSPVIVSDYPANIKAFYMRLNEDKKTVSAMDILFPEIGEIVGGSQREERLSVLTDVMKQRGMDISMLDWYLDTRRFGSVVHSGFGLGFERLVQFVAGVGNIRDACLCPRHK